MAKILIAEDERDISYILGEALKKKGHTVTFAYDGEETLAAARKENPDLLILDIMMPKMDGLTVHQELKSDPKTRKIYVMVQTAKADIGKLVLEDKKYAVDGFMEKPFDLNKFFNMVEEILAKKQV